MGFFNAILTGLGLEEEINHKTVIKPRRRQERSYEQAKEQIYEQFNLHENTGQEDPHIKKTTFHPQANNLAIFAPKTHLEVQKIVNSLKLEQSCIVNLEFITEAEKLRILDFFSGALFALGGDITRIQGDLFLVTPKTVHIKVN
jgi:cell division inhibitor SepF